MVSELHGQMKTRKENTLCCENTLCGTSCLSHCHTVYNQLYTALILVLPNTDDIVIIIDKYGKFQPAWMSTFVEFYTYVHTK